MAKNMAKKFIVTTLLSLLFSSSFVAQAQQPPPQRRLTILPPNGLSIIPVMEGWYDNDDGSVTISFGYHNKNAPGEEGLVMIPRGANNRIEPVEFDGLQPTFFEVGRHTGIFTVTLPESMREESVWWYLKTGDNPEYKVPGRATEEPYILDLKPRPQGSVSPYVWFKDGDEPSQGPMGAVSESAAETKVGDPLTLTAHVRDPSPRDRTDPRFIEPIPLRVNFAVHQGPAPVDFSVHDSTQATRTGAVVTGPAALFAIEQGDSPVLEDVVLKEGEGTAKVIATFNEPGDYLIRIMVDNFAATDSLEADQCCWTNIYQRVTVSE